MNEKTKKSVGVHVIGGWTVEHSAVEGGDEIVGDKPEERLATIPHHWLDFKEPKAKAMVETIIRFAKILRHQSG